MKTTTLLLAFAGSITAFTLPSSQPKSSTSLNALADLPGGTRPLANFDPLNLAELGEDDYTLLWFRAAELKHSRIAMLATTGYLVQATGFHFPGMLSSEVSFESLSKLKPFEAWDAMPDAGKAQIFGICFIAELSTESKKVHYTKGGELPQVVFPKFDFSGLDPADLARRQNRELNNGRLAMIGIMSFIAANNIPGSVPALTGIDAF